MSSKKGRSRPLWDNIDWDSPSLGEPTIVNATLNSLTNEFEVSQPNRPRSKFDFGSNNTSNDWVLEAQRNWNTEAIDGDPYSIDNFQHQQEDYSHRFSSRDDAAATFRLNLEIDDQPIFAKVTDYSSFRTQEIIPDFDSIITNEEIKDPEEWESRHWKDPFPDIPVNRVKTPYESVDQYLYTHFELMRQDFLIPLQQAVKSYKEVYNYSKDKADVGEAMESVSAQKPYRLYEHVRLNAIVFGNRQPLYRVSFRLPYYIRVNWQQSKRLIPGTLVLLSKDHFEKDLKIATVVNRGDEPMRGPNRFEYLIDLYLERDDENQPLGYGDPTMNDEDVYVMIEATDGYFEAYRHVLGVFKNITAEELPFSQYLVNLSNNVLIPHYASRKKYYNLNVKKGSREQWTINITEDWPSFSSGMDKTQMDALKTILSNNLSIVQGPPGTGKTFVGTYAMRVLLNNFGASIGPIVCICQTNHALDQFLEHILDHTNQIVRVGGRSKSELLKDHTLYELKKEHKRPRGVGRLYRSRDNVVREIKKTLIELYEEPCVTVDFIESIKGLRPRQLDSLRRIGERKSNNSKNAKKNAIILDDDDSEDDWVISSVDIPPAKPVTNSKNDKNNRNNKNKKPEPVKKARDDWFGGNPNHQQEVKEKPVNPVELWLKEAIEYVADGDAMSTLADEMKQNYLEQQKGLVFEELIDERELIEEEELEEKIQVFQGDEQDYKSQFIQIGKSYQRQTEPGLGEPPERKIVNYQKARAPAVIKASATFNFFDNNDEDTAEDHTKYSLERWMKEDDVGMWPLPVRLQAHKHWAEQKNAALQAKLDSLMICYHDFSKDIRKVMASFEAKICRENRVVGMTSTAAAKYHDLLVEMRPRIMVVEEAAEMLESHIISALTDSLEHLILIGDHQQLRPSTSVHALAENHALGVSLFERLVMNKFPYTRLSHQRRMRPDIRMLINPIYKDPPLQDHPDVFTYPPVRGMDQSMFFLAHNEDEMNMSESASKVNEHEAKMAARLSVYLLLQGYSPEEITIITMYSGQKSLIKRTLRDERRPNLDTELIQVSSVDGYQGEENKIIILSLVRSNSNGQIGFLRVVNRVCVALSRAKHGLYILGNARLLCEKSDLWNEIVANIEDRNENMIGTKFVLKCAKHGERTEIQWPVDFTEVEEGGCKKPCDEVLACGHKCTLKCHPYDHSEYRCKMPCKKELSCKHPCMHRCCEPCGNCLYVTRLRLPCGHTVDKECHVLRANFKNRANEVCPVCKASFKC